MITLEKIPFTSVAGQPLTLYLWLPYLQSAQDGSQPKHHSCQSLSLIHI